MNAEEFAHRCDDAPEKTAAGWKVLCPAHGDNKTKSLGIKARIERLGEEA